MRVLALRLIALAVVSVACAPIPYLRPPLGDATRGTGTLAVGGGPAWNASPTTGLAVFQMQGRGPQVDLGSATAYLDVGFGAQAGLFSLNGGANLGAGLVIARVASVAVEIEGGWYYWAASLPIALHAGDLVTVYAAPGWVGGVGAREGYVRTPVGASFRIDDRLGVQIEGGYTIRPDRPLWLGRGELWGNTNAYAVGALSYRFDASPSGPRPR